MECKEDAAVERQKLVPDDEIENDHDDEQPGLPNAPVVKTIQTPISPVLSKVFSSGETSRTQDSSNCSVGKGNYDGGPYPTKLLYINERKAENKTNDSKKSRKIPREIDVPSASSLDETHKNFSFEERPLKHHSFLSEVPDVRHMERALIGLLEDFHSGKLKAFGSGCTMEQMTDIREQQEHLAKLHFEVGAGGDPLSNCNSAQKNMCQLVQKLENLSVSIEKLHSSNSNL